MKQTLRMKLILTFLIVAAAIVVLGVFALFQLDSINSHVNTYAKNVTPGIYTIGEVKYYVAHYRRQQILHLLYTDQPNIEATEQKIIQDEELMANLLDTYQKDNLLSENEESQLKTFQDNWNTYIEQSKGFLPLSQQGKKDEAWAVLSGEADKTYDKVMQSVADWSAFKRNVSDEMAVKSRSTYILAMNVITLGMVLTVLLAIVMGVVVSGPIASNARKMAQAADGISRGELEHNLNIKTHDEIGDTAAAFNRMIIYLKGMASVAEKIAAGDLRDQVVPLSHKDELGNAFATMIEKLNSLLVRYPRAPSRWMGLRASYRWLLHIRPKPPPRFQPPCSRLPKELASRPNPYRRQPL